MKGKGSPWLLRFGLVLLAAGGYFALYSFITVLTFGRPEMVGTPGIVFFVALLGMGLGLYYIVSAALSED